MGIPVGEMLERMTAHEFVGYQAAARHEPFGFPWENWRQSWLAFMVDRTRQRGKRDKVYPREDFEWKAPDPLFTPTGKKENRGRRRTKVRSN
jgi:hypothetical protein